MTRDHEITSPRRLHIAAFVVLGGLLAGCSSPTHMQYDYGRASTAAFTTQADLTRPSVANAAHPLQGLEAASIRLRVHESSTDSESGESQLEAGALQ